MAPLPAGESHPFPQPDDLTTRVWRYYDAARFRWLLENSQLYLPSIALLDDHFAGSVPNPEIIKRAEFLQDLGQQDLVDYYAGKLEQLRKSVYVSCWRLGNDDSNAMWQLYCGDEEGVAIRTTYANLVDTFASKWRSVGLVTYLNYAKDDIPEGNVRHPYMYKRSEFAYENEVRIAEGLDPFLDPTPKRVSDHIPEFRTISIHPVDLINDLVLHPNSTAAQRGVIRSTVGAHAPGLADRIRWSELRQ